jgi:hypothetical protein
LTLGLDLEVGGEVGAAAVVLPVSPVAFYAQVQVQNVENVGLIPRAEGYRPAAIRESRIKDRPAKSDPKDSALSIKIELDLEVEVDLYARVKGDVTIRLM